jgi:hypothetical protein
MTLIQEILSRAGVELKLHSFKRNEVSLCCPFCEERGYGVDEKFHYGINTVSGKSYCFRCFWASRDVIYAARALSKVFDVPFRLRYALEPEEQPEVKEPKPVPTSLPKEYERFNGNKDEVEREMRAYLKKRLVSTLQITKHKIGFAACGNMAYRILFPVISSDQQIYGCVGRTIKEDVKPKYLNTSGVKILWGCHVFGTTAVIVEGILDALRVEQALLFHKNYVAVARLGSVVTQVQLKQLRRYERRIILPDWDEPGVKGAMELAKECAACGLSVSVAVPQGMTGMDPGGMLPEQIDGAIATALPWGKTTEMRLRMAMTK